MKVLLTEDSPDIVEAIVAHVRGTIAGGDVVVARGADEAIRALDTGPFDLFICDRKLPAVAGSLDSSEVHGDQVITLCAERYPGTPMLVFTAYPGFDMFTSLLRRARRGDPFGEGTASVMVQVFRKADLDKCVKEISRVAGQLDAVNSVEMDQHLPSGARLRSSEIRVLKIFARAKHGRMVRVRKIGGGLSKTTTYRVEVEDGRGVLRARAFAKLGKLEVLEQELKRYHEFLPAMLPGGAYAPFADRVECGAGDVGGLFYSLAEAPGSTLWTRLLASPGQASALVGKTSETLEAWNQAATRVETTVREVRRGLLADDALAKRVGESILGQRWHGFESRQVNTRRSPSHGDLHAQNVLVSAADDVMLIDYGDVRRSQASLDFVVLELSLLFHPENVCSRWPWPSLDAAANWRDVDSFVHGAPGASYVRACRQAALRRAAGPREVYAVAYAYALRQFKYADTNKDIAAAIIRSAVSAFDET